MNMQKVGKIHGRNMADWINTVPAELERDAVNLCQILTAGQLEYGLDGDDLKSFISQCILALLDAGALPVRTSGDWMVEPRFGNARADIVSGVIAEWQSSNGDPVYPWTVWFARPKG